MSKTRGPLYPEVMVQLSGEDGNVFSIIGRAIRAARGAAVNEAKIEEFKNEMMSGDYDHALQTCMKWFDCG